VIGVHTPGYSFGRDRDTVARAVERLEIPFAVALDSGYEVWRLYGNERWPALYLADRRGVLRYYHFGEGAYEETELAIQELLLEVNADLELPSPMTPLRETDRSGALVQVPTPHSYLEEDRSARRLRAGDVLSIRYRGATAAAVLDGRGEVQVVLDGKPLHDLTLEGPRLYELVQSDFHEEHELRLRFRGEARAYAFSFAPGAA
jgi:hypothetical protein